MADDRGQKPDDWCRVLAQPPAKKKTTDQIEKETMNNRISNDE
jgi:hypothetical protein